MANIVIGMATMGSVDTKTLESLFRLNKGEHRVALLTTEYSLVYDARERIVQKALENPNTDYVLFIDSDIVFEPDTLDKLIKDAEESPNCMISGAYPYKIENEIKFVGTATDGDDILPVLPFENPQIYASYIGMGMCLIPRIILEKVCKDYWLGKIFHPFTGMGEDVSFCKRVTNAGFEIIVDRNITCGHVGKKVYGEF